jgi:KDO2-lipid IV(A) lauroyltransferase
MARAMERRDRRRGDAAADRAVRSLFWLGRRLPYDERVRLIGWAASRLVAPVAGWPERIRANLEHVMPEMPAAERRRLVREVPDNAGRTLAEIYSGGELAARLSGTPVEGEGLATLEAARAEGRPAILVTAHFGNYVAPRIALMSRGFQIAGLYRPMRNARFNAHYVEAMEAIGRPMFASGRHGLGALLRHLRGGGMVGMLTDVYAKHAPALDFLGRPAPTALSAAEMALKFDAPLLPAYGIRQPDGLSFRVVIEPPVTRGDPRAMTQALNDSLAARVRAHPAQWFWIHRRWKPERQRARAAARMGP